MNFPYKVVVQGKGSETLNKNDYIAAGGEGTVCRRGSTAYKVYHDPKRMISVAKVRELAPLARFGNILGPRDILLDGKTNKPIGFTMPYIEQTEFLCRMFGKGFKTDNGITPDAIMHLVKRMQLTVSEIHREGILVVDLNEMNFLLDKNFQEVLFIDVDSYQTPTFKATAIMESIRDRSIKFGDFSEGSDWYSFAIVAWQMYVGYHPYRKGKHAKYGPNDWSVRMDKGLSVFHPDVSVGPPWSDWSAVPPAHLAWFKEVLGPSGARCEPPLPDVSGFIAVLRPVVVKGTDSFEVSLYRDYGEPAFGVWFFDGSDCAITKEGVYVGGNLVKKFTSKPGKVSLARVPGSHPVLAEQDSHEVVFHDMQGGLVGRIAADKAMQYDGRIYTAYNGVLTESSFAFMNGKVLHFMKPVGNVLQQSTTMFPGVAVQDVLGTCWLAIPYTEGKCSNCRVKELDGHRIIDAKHERGVFMAVAEKDGKYKRFVLFMSDDFSSYKMRIDDDPSDPSVHFTVLANGICVHQPTDQQVEVFRDPTKVKVVDGPPFHTGDRLLNDTTSVMFLDGGRLYSVRLK
jgi:hypothetical protein